MPSWFRRTERTTDVLALATASEAGAMASLAEGLGEAGRLRIHPDSEALLADSGFARATLILLGGAEGGAPEIAGRVAAARNCQGRQGAGCEVAVLAEDPLVQIRLRDLDASLPAGIRVRPVSRAAMLARRVFADAPPDRVLRLETPADGLPLLIIGPGDALSAQLMLAALRLLQLPGLRPAVTLAGPGMPGLLARLRAALPELDRCGVLTAHETVGGEGSRPALILATDASVPDATLQALDPDRIAPVVRPEMPTWSATGQTLRDDAADRIARDIHLLHLEERGAAGGRAGDQPSQAPWEALPERFREASRHQASHIPLKLRWAGARILPPGKAIPFGWTSAELAALTAAEHARWATVSRLEGWSYGPARSDAAKTTPLLVDFGALSPAIRDLDALPVRAAPRHVGRPVRRDVIVAVEGDAGPEPGFPRAFRAALEALREDALVLRLQADNPLTRAAAAAAGVPIHLAMTDVPGADLARRAERIAVGAAAIALLPAPTRTMRVAGDGTTKNG